MFFKLICLLSTFLIQSGTAQIIGAYGDVGCLGAPWGAPYAEWPLGPANLAASSGGGFAVTSLSPIAPTGVSIASENAYDGVISILGQIPFLSAVALEGALPTVGTGAITYGCGNGYVAMLTEDIAPVLDPLAYAAPGPYGLYGYGPAGPAGIAGPALGPCGCGRGALF